MEKVPKVARRLEKDGGQFALWGMVPLDVFDRRDNATMATQSIFDSRRNYIGEIVDDPFEDNPGMGCLTIIVLFIIGCALLKYMEG